MGEFDHNFTEAYDYFNDKLFDGSLPGAIVTLQRRRGARGYYSWDRFMSKEDGRDDKADEIALNPDDFERDDKEILSTLVHEMCHQKARCDGVAGRPGYHNKAWGEIMKNIGLHPSNTSEPGGKQTGQNMSHYIIDGDLFDTHAIGLIESGFKLYWFGLKNPTVKRPKSKFKYTCHGCMINAWAKKDVSILCGECGNPLVMEDE